ncbi:MAG: PfkB family carbohydrate kinase, partial [Burkholderiaceae bacterium]
MSVKISGSIAFDTIMVFQGRFREHILPDQVHMLNVAFLAPEMRQEYGGCAANIAYTLKGLGQDCSLLGAIGRDGAQYLERLRGLGIETSQVLTAEDCFSAQAFITTDLDDNQITAFHPGAMNRAGEVGIGQS